MKVIWRTDLRGRAILPPGSRDRPIIYSLVCRASVDTFSSPSLLSDRDFFHSRCYLRYYAISYFARLRQLLYGRQLIRKIVDLYYFSRFLFVIYLFIYLFITYFIERWNLFIFSNIFIYPEKRDYYLIIY